MHTLQDFDYIQLLFLGVFGFAWLVQLYFLWRYFFPVSRIPRAERSGAGQPVPVSIIISARNEAANLMEHVPAIMEQDHPEMELIVVNDSSWDDTEAILKALQLRYPELRVILLDEEKQNMQGKKFALTLAIKAAKHDTILLTDADCAPAGPEWARRMAACFTGRTEIVLGFSPYRRHPGWLNRLIRFDTLMIGLHYLGFARSGMPYMGVGRNLAYRREVFFRHGGFRTHYHLASGDDDLFVNQAANVRNTAVCVDPPAQTESEAKRTWSQWFAQKRRHFTTIPHYRARHRNLLAAWPLSYFFLWLGASGALVLQAGVWIVAGMLLSRYIMQLAILRATSRRLGQPGDLVWLGPLLELQLHVLNLGLYFSNLVRKPQKWN